MSPNCLLSPSSGFPPSKDLLWWKVHRRGDQADIGLNPGIFTY